MAAHPGDHRARTHCNAPELTFQDLGPRAGVGHFDGGPVTSDAGGLLLRAVEAQVHFLDQFARCFTDYRDPDRVEHSLPDLLKQRIVALCLGYGDLNDHDRLRHDPLLAVLVGKEDPSGAQRARARARGKALNARRLRELGPALEQAQQQFPQTGVVARVCHEFTYRPLASWSRQRRVVGKAEHLAKGPNPRFVVTSLTAAACAGQTLYAQEYCGCGAMENRIKEQQLMRFANRVSCVTMRANPVRLGLATVAQVLLRALREHGLAPTELAQAPCDTIRVKRLKIGAVIRVSVRRVAVSLAEAYPLRAVFVRVWEQLAALTVPPRPAVVGSG